MAILGSIEDHIAVLDHLGFIVFTNKAWDDFANAKTFFEGRVIHIGGGNCLVRDFGALVLV